MTYLCKWRHRKKSSKIFENFISQEWYSWILIYIQNMISTNIVIASNANLIYNVPYISTEKTRRKSLESREFIPTARGFSFNQIP